jgi:hypothetical protein
MLARGLGWDILTIAIGPALTGQVRETVQDLRALNATAGVAGTPLEIVPVDLTT